MGAGAGGSSIRARSIEGLAALQGAYPQQQRMASSRSVLPPPTRVASGIVSTAPRFYSYTPTAAAAAERVAAKASSSVRFFDGLRRPATSPLLAAASAQSPRLAAAAAGLDERLAAAPSSSSTRRSGPLSLAAAPPRSPWAHKVAMGCGASTVIGKKKLNEKSKTVLADLFKKMDTDGDGKVDKAEAKAFFKGTFAKISAEAMFNEVDSDANGGITCEEFLDFWEQVRRSGYKDDDIQEEVANLMQGGAWVDWKDSRDVSAGGPAKRKNSKS